MADDKDTLTRELTEILAKEGMVDVGDLTPDKKLQDLDIQSADFVMILMAIEEQYGAYISVDNELTDMETVQDLLDFAISRIEEHRKDTA